MGQRGVHTRNKLTPAHGSYIYYVHLWAVATYLAAARAIPSLVGASTRTALEASRGGVASNEGCYLRKHNTTTSW